MNNLNTQQIILLCLLVSFVTSIATGITTVSLLEQAPDPVTQTINRVVEKTVERVVELPNNNNDEEENNNSNQPIIERVVETVVVNQEDLTVEAVAKNKPTLVKIYGLNRFGKEFYVGTGITIEPSGSVLTDTVVSNQASTFVIDYGGVKATSTVSETLGQNAVVLTPGEGQSAPAVSYGNSQALKLGQTVIAISGTEAGNIVSTGIVTQLETTAGFTSEGDISASTVPTDPVTKIHTSIGSGQISAGAILLNLKGEVVGVRVGQISGTSTFLPSNQVSALRIAQ